MKILSVVGARPNFMKIAPFCRALTSRIPQCEHVLVHTGQHYDVRMSRSFFETLRIPDPDYNLEVGSGSHAFQVGTTMIEFEKVLLAEKPDWVVVVGDVNATCSCAITARKHGVSVAHIEAGLRSFDMSMPEEINRLVTDRIANLLFAPDVISRDNLRREGTEEKRIRVVGNIMIDTLEKEREKAAVLDPVDIVGRNRLESAKNEISRPLPDNHYAVMTLHRPSNVDRKDTLDRILRFVVEKIDPELPVVWPLHPRTRARLEAFGLWKRTANAPGLLLTEPLGYHELLRLNMGARIMLTDSGGLQEECCVLGTPCLTLRNNTERPVTLLEHGGVSLLAGNDVAKIREAYRRLLEIPKQPCRPPLWDGHTAERIVEALLATVIC